MILRQSTAVTVEVGPFVDSTDGSTAETGLTITQPDIRLSKNGGSFAQKSAAGTASHMENGYYSVSLSTTDTNTVGRLRLHVVKAGALPVWMDFYVVEEAIYDALYAANATGLLPANVTQFGGINGTFSSGRPEVNVSHWGGTAVASAVVNANVTQISGDSTAADNLEAAADGTGYNLGGGSIVAASVTGAVGSVTGNVGGNVTGSVGSVTGNVGGTVNGLTATAQGHVRTAVGLASADLDDQLSAIVEDTGTTLPATLSTIDGVVDAIKVTTDKLDDTLELDSTVYRFTEHALAQAPSGGGGGSGATAQEVWEYANRTLTALDEDSTTLDIDTAVRAAVGLSSANLDTQIAALPTAAENADAVLDEALSGHTTAGTLGKAVADILADTGTDGVVVAAGSKSGYSLAADQSGVTIGTVNALGTQAKADVNAEVDSALSDYDPPTNAELEARTLAAANYATAANLATVDSVVDAIKAVTDNLPDSGALTSLATAAALATVDGNVDSILEDTGTTLPALIASELSDALTSDVIADSVPPDGSRPTIAQALYMIVQFLTERAVSGTTLTVKKPDGSTALMTFTLDDSANPTSITRAS